MVSSGQTAASLHACQALSAFFIRQPVSAMIAMRCGCAFGNGSVRPATLAACAPAGSVASQTDTGKLDGFESAGSLAVGRWATVAAAARSVMRDSLPSTVNCGHSGSLADAGV
jgi:hypothetical protein